MKEFVKMSSVNKNVKSAKDKILYKQKTLIDKNEEKFT